MKIGSYLELCAEAPLSVCPLLGGPYGLPSKCFGKSFKIGSMFFFEAPTFIIYLISWVMTGIMIYNIKKKTSGMGQREFITFFYVYFGHLVIEMITISNAVPTSSPAYLYFAAFHYGSTIALSWCLFLNSFVNYQFIPEGERKSVWGLRLSSLGVFALSSLLAISTFKGWGWLSPLSPTLLWWMHFVFPNAFVLTFLITQVAFVYCKLDNKWPIGDLINSFVFYIAAQVLLSKFSFQLCESSKHYLDGHFFQALCLLFAVMMLYKYWDSINKEDIEFTIEPLQAELIPGPPKTIDGKVVNLDSDPESFSDDEKLSTKHKKRSPRSKNKTKKMRLESVFSSPVSPTEV